MRSSQFGTCLRSSFAFRNSGSKHRRNGALTPWGHPRGAVPPCHRSGLIELLRVINVNEVGTPHTPQSHAANYAPYEGYKLALEICGAYTAN
ncbi:unnamed protein product [Calypogeia fissa]